MTSRRFPSPTEKNGQIAEQVSWIAGTGNRGTVRQTMIDGAHAFIRAYATRYLFPSCPGGQPMTPAV